MKKPVLEITQNNQSGLHGKCSSCETYFSSAGPGLLRNPGAAMKTMQRQSTNTPNRYIGRKQMSALQNHHGGSTRSSHET